MKQILNAIIVSLLLLNSISAFAETEVVFYHTDNFGTPLAMTDMSGKVVWRSDELPFGEEYSTEEIGEQNSRRFLGKEMDKESGLIYMGARYLDPKTGRFNRPDPVGFVDPFNGGKVNQEMLVDPQRHNRYAYGLNNPYRYVDPDGEFAFAGIALFAAGAWALDAMMPKSTGVSNSRGALDYIDNATIVAPAGAIKNVSKLPKAIKGTTSITKSSRKRVKRLISGLSDNSRQNSGLSQEKTDQLRRIVNKAGGKIRNDGVSGVKGSSAGKPHVQTEGLGKSVDSRHIWTERGVK